MRARASGQPPARMLLIVAWAVVLAPGSTFAQSNCLLHTSDQYVRMGGQRVLGPLPCSACYKTLKQMSGGSCEPLKDPAPSGQRQDQPSQPDRAAEERRREGENRKAEEDKRRAEDLKRKAEQEENDRARKATLGSMKGSPDQTLEIKGATGSFNLKGNPGDVTLKGAGAPAGSASVPTGWRQLCCAVAISNSAAAAALAADYDEAQYLIGQSRSVMTGGKVDVQCPPAPPVPAPAGRPGEAATSPVDVLYTELAKSTTTEVERLLDIRTRFPDPAKAKAETHKEVTARTLVLGGLKAEPAQTAEQVKQKKTRVAEALAALEQAKAAEADADAAMAQTTQATATLVRNRDVLAKVKDNPSRAADLLAEIQKPPAPPKR